MSERADVPAGNPADDPTGDIAAVLACWFGPGAATGDYRFREAWFRAEPEFDRLVERQLGALHRQAADGGCDGWAGTAEGALALILLLDQVPRNLYRGTARAFATDAAAKATAEGAIAQGLDQHVPAMARLFFYLPFEHSEDLADQDRACALIATLGQPASLDYAWRHRAVIARFGRFPHRNAALGRSSTPEELAFLAQPGSSF